MAKLFSDNSVSDMITAAIIRLLPSACLRSIPAKWKCTSFGSPFSTASKSTTPCSSTRKHIVAATPAAMITIAAGNLGITFPATRSSSNAPTPSTTDSQLISLHVSAICLSSSGSSPDPAFPPRIFGICIRIIVSAIPLINPPITGVEMKSTILPAFKK